MIELPLAALAGAALGLWWGERGRRIDAQRREVSRPVLDVPRAKLVDPVAVNHPDGTYGELDAARAAYIERAVHEGYDAEEAGLDFDRMYGSLGDGQPKL